MAAFDAWIAQHGKSYEDAVVSPLPACPTCPLACHQAFHCIRPTPALCWPPGLVPLALSGASTCRLNVPAECVGCTPRLPLLQEKAKRRAVFQQNAAYVAEHNAQNSGLTLALNAFADLTFEEFSRTHLGLSPQANAANRWVGGS